MTSDILKRAAEAVEGVTLGPWEYRPDRDDDWGIVKVDHCVICQARDPEKLGREILAEHRETGIDPWGPNARFIAAARTLIPDMSAAIAERDEQIERLNHLFDLSQKTTEAVLARTEAAEMETMEQARLNGMGAERELALMAKAERWERLFAATTGMVSIVEGIDGVMNHGVWRDERGMRLKDTPEWVSLYNNHAAMKEGR